MRIQKYISQCGVCSRRTAERKIADGSVSVNGVPAALGQSIDPSVDVVRVDGKIARGFDSKRLVLAMNKPKGVLCTNSDPFGGRTVFDILPRLFSEMRLFCCGRLDKNSRGLLILTNDGSIANRITHPSSGIVKRYRVLLNRDFDTSLTDTLLRGVDCDGEKLKALRIIPDSSNRQDSPRRMEVWLAQGRKREIRRMFEAAGYFVKELKRFQIGMFELKRIPEGSVKVLGGRDIGRLLDGGFEKFEQ